MRVAVSGSSGLIGRALLPALDRAGSEVVRLVRPGARSGPGDVGPGPGDVVWDPGRQQIDSGGLEGVDAVVHLAGEGIAEGRWSATRKRRILESRTRGTRLLAETLSGLVRRPRVLVSASAIGYYGDRGDQVLDEESPAGRGFLPEVCVAWEEAAAPASDAGIRVVRLRIGPVLSREGGALSRMLPLFRIGVGGRLGHGRQYMSWIALDDLVRVIASAIGDESLSGPVNAVAPGPVTNAEFTRALGRALGRPAILPVPALALRVAVGEMADALLLASARVLPRRLERGGFRFEHPDVEEALRSLL